MPWVGVNGYDMTPLRALGKKMRGIRRRLLLVVVDVDCFGAFLEVADAVLDAFERCDGDDALDAVGEDADTEEYAEDGAYTGRVAQGEEAEDKAAQAKQCHKPPAVVAGTLVVERQHRQGDAFEHNPNGEDDDKALGSYEAVAYEKDSDDNLEHCQERGGTCIGQILLSFQPEQKAKHACEQYEKAYDGGHSDEAFAGIEDAYHAQHYEQQGGNDKVEVDFFHISLNIKTV